MTIADCGRLAATLGEKKSVEKGVSREETSLVKKVL